ncbi:unnamed protein product [Periconia digitata]|uniref:Cytochrome P450 n=1 Tax=Periconia digitata TaxID=1303443 RepID=A0A9W4UCE1_9PLEO|nr:unnamed protein product [Periconia digitata]
MAWLILLAFILTPFLTHYITTFLFRRQSKNRSPPRKPPTIPYWVPGLYHALGLLSKPSTYFALLIKKYGAHAPFTVKIGRVSYLVVRSSEHCRSLLRQSSSTKAKSNLTEIYDKVFGTTRDAIRYYQINESVDQDSGPFHPLLASVHSKYQDDVEFKSLTDTFISIFRRNMSNKMFQPSSWTQIEDLWSFLEIEITRGAVETLFGSALIKNQPKLVRDYWDFQSKTGEFIPGLPRFTISSAVPPRDRLLEGIRKWLQTTHGGTDFAQIKASDPVWDEKRGSKFIQECDATFAQIPSFNYQARASECLRIIHNISSAAMPSTFWHIVEILRNQALTDYLSREVLRHAQPTQDKYDLAAITKLPNLQSLSLEIKRIRTATYMLRTSATPDAHLDNNWVIPNRTSVLAFSQDIGLNTALWSKARPQITTRPLAEFWSDRFLIPDKSASTKRYRKGRDSVTTGTFSLDGIETLHEILSGGIGDECCSDLEIRLADVFTAAAVAVLLAEFEMNLCDGDDVEAGLPPVGEVAYGVLKPLEKVAVRLKLRSG